MPFRFQRLALDHPDLAGDGAALQARAATATRAEAPRLQRLWQYYRNPITAVAASDAARPYTQAQEWGLPARITGAIGGDAARKEVVIENDIGWRVDTMVELMPDCRQPPPLPLMPKKRPRRKRPRPYPIKPPPAPPTLPSGR